MTDIEANDKLGAHLLHSDSDPDLINFILPNREDLILDLEMGIILDSMSRGDKEIRKTCEAILLSPLQNIEEIRYRQSVLKDSLDNREIVRKMHSIIMDTINKARRQLFWVYKTNPEMTLHESLTVMGIYIYAIQELRQIAIVERKNFSSKGFLSLFSLLTDVFNEDFSKKVAITLKKLEFTNGVKVEGKLGRRAELIDFILLDPETKRGIGHAINRIKTRKYTFVLPPRDDQGAKELMELRAMGTATIANVLINAGENVLNFLKTLYTEIAFLVGCINLADDVKNAGANVCYPEPVTGIRSHIGFGGLIDVALSLKIGKNTVENDLSAGHQKLTMITGANRGGKSTFLRSIGQAVLMMQAGMFVCATEFTSSAYSGIFTHFKREEDRKMEQGKFDEELARMSSIVDNIKPNSLILFNESFAATNAREGSDIAGEIINALLDTDVTIFFVTHLYELADLFLNESNDRTRFLLAERTAEGTRTFKILPGKPEETSYGQDLYMKLFGKDKLNDLPKL